MYTSSAYYHNKHKDFKDKTHPLFVCSCGTYHLYTIPRLPTHMPRGRMDYQILYVASGKAHFYFHGKEEIIEAGNMVIYRPHEEQKYYYYGVDQTEVYWVHFTGCDVKNIMRKYGIADDVHTIFTGTSLAYKNLFLKMISELQQCRSDYEEMLVHYLNELFIILHRITEEKPKPKSIMLMQEMDDAVSYFQAHYNTTISIKDYAKSHNMSNSWFIQNFKEYTHYTPNQYILALRIHNAKALLQTSQYNVAEISNIVGYDNPLYFSRIFKKQCGVTPSEYRKQPFQS